MTDPTQAPSKERAMQAYPDSFKAAMVKLHGCGEGSTSPNNWIALTRDDCRALLVALDDSAHEPLPAHETLVDELIGMVDEAARDKSVTACSAFEEASAKEINAARDRVLAAMCPSPPPRVAVRLDQAGEGSPEVNKEPSGEQCECTTPKRSTKGDWCTTCFGTVPTK